MKTLNFKDTNAQKIYDDYLRRVKRVTSSLTKQDQLDVLMEVNSHIYESMLRKNPDNELEELLESMERFGAPEEVLKPLVAERTLSQATRTFNPLHVLKALALNIGNSFIYLFFSFLYLLLFGFIFLIGAKLYMPEKIGLFFKEDQFLVLGRTSMYQDPSVQELFGIWFIPLMVLSGVILYLMITLLLRLFRKRRS